MDHRKEQTDNARAFARLIIAEKVQAALWMMSNEKKGGLLTPDQPVGDGGDNVLQWTYKTGGNIFHNYHYCNWL